MLGGGKLDQAKLDELRSTVAEAVALDDAQARGRVTPPFADGLRSDLAKDLRKLAADPVLGPAARAAAEALSRGDRAGLAGLRDRLVALERAHGRAA